MSQVGIGYCVPGSLGLGWLIELHVSYLNLYGLRWPSVCFIHIASAIRLGHVRIVFVTDIKSLKASGPIHLAAVK
jgi:hypothetical protein